MVEMVESPYNYIFPVIVVRQCLFVALKRSAIMRGFPPFTGCSGIFFNCKKVPKKVAYQRIVIII